MPTSSLDFSILHVMWKLTSKRGKGAGVYGRVEEDGGTCFMSYGRVVSGEEVGEADVDNVVLTCVLL